jgi:zinc/manganese transport system substrate-binding protein
MGLETSRRRVVCLLAAFALTGLWLQSARAETPVPVVASFSILGDMVREVGGERVRVTTLVGPGGDAHVYQPTPADARAVAAARVVFVNGLGFEGWIDRLIAAAGFKGPVVVATKGITPLTMTEEGARDDHDRHHAAGEGHGDIDPHAWQNLANGQVYVRNIAAALIAADPGGAASYRANAERYLAEIAALDQQVRTAIAALPADRRTIVTSHDAFGYFAAAYGLKLLAPEGVSTEADVSAKNVARLITQIRAEKIPAVFMETITDPRLMEQIRRETGAAIGGTLYSDALSPPDGPAATYLEMLRWNVATLTRALSS